VTDVNQMKVQVLELSDKQGLILDLSDLELILGIAALIEMGEEVPAIYASRVNNIYKKALEVAYG